MSLSLAKKDLDSFLRSIIEQWPTYGPVEDKEGVKSRFRFARLTRAKDYYMLYGPTVIPPKKYLFPAKEDVFRFEKGEILPPTNQDFVLFGVNKRDGEGLFYLDRIYDYPVPEVHYQKRREQMKLVVVDSLPPSANLHCDLYLQIIGKDTFAAYPFSDFGEKLVAGNKLFGHSKDSGEISVRHMPDEVIFHPRIAEIVENSRDSKIWDRLAQVCFNCGICSYTCPMCYCYNDSDRIDITKNVEKDLAGGRERTWDSCMLPDFAAVTFKDFRPKHKERIYNWYYHKFVRMPREQGFVGCIDCGRCITYCPARINYRKVLKNLIDTEKRTKANPGKGDLK